MTKVIVIDKCSICPHSDHKGAFGRISYIPVCRLANRELPYEVVHDRHFGTTASRVDVIPEWCPLEDR